MRVFEHIECLFTRYVYRQSKEFSQHSRKRPMIEVIFPRFTQKMSGDFKNNEKFTKIDKN